MLCLGSYHLDYNVIACSVTIPLYFKTTTSSASENNIKPVVVYTNADTHKLEILKDNKGKSGVYR